MTDEAGFRRDAPTALVIVDMVVDSVIGFWPVHDPHGLVRAVVRLREACHAAGVPVVQLQHLYRADGLNAALDEARHPDGTPRACVEGTPGAAIVPELDPGDRDVVVRKHRWHGFLGTELEAVLHGLGAEQLLWAGTFTDCCVSLSVFEAYMRDYRNALVVDAMSCANPFTHRTAVLTMANWIPGLTVFTADGVEGWLRGEQVQSWTADGHNTVEYTSGLDVDRLYGDVLRIAGAQSSADAGRVVA